jgi:hypothetical protein
MENPIVAIAKASALKEVDKFKNNADLDHDGKKDFVEQLPPVIHDAANAANGLIGAVDFPQIMIGVKKIGEGFGDIKAGVDFEALKINAKKTLEAAKKLYSYASVVASFLQKPEPGAVKVTKK